MQGNRRQKSNYNWIPPVGQREGLLFQRDQDAKSNALCGKTSKAQKEIVSKTWPKDKPVSCFQTGRASGGISAC